MAIVSGVHSYEKLTAPGPAKVEMNLEVVFIPVSDVDRAKEFYAKLGWRLDADFKFDNGFRVVQFTQPVPAVPCNLAVNITSAAPGSTQGTYLIVSDIADARKELVGAESRLAKCSRCDAGCSVPARGQQRSRQRTSAGLRQLQFFCNI